MRFWGNLGRLWEFWFRRLSPDCDIILAPVSIIDRLQTEKHLADELHGALELMCTNRGILPSDVSSVCSALELYDSVRRPHQAQTDSGE